VKRISDQENKEIFIELGNSLKGVVFPDGPSFLRESSFFWSPSEFLVLKCGSSISENII
jgi:hypothetical protein